MKLRRRSLTIGAVLSLTLASCGSSSGGGQDLVQADLARSEPSPSESGPAVTVTNAVAADLYRQVARQEEGNVALSPASIATALAMARGGARGNTLTQMDAVLGIDDPATIDRSMNALDAALASRNGTPASPDGVRDLEVVVANANALWPQAGMRFEQPFLDLLAREYGTGLHTVDYRDDAEGARRQVNEWVGQRTRDRIPDLLPDGSVTSDTRLVLANALYLKAPWTERFMETADVTFARPDGTSVQVPAISGGKRGRYVERDGWRAAEVPLGPGPAAAGFGELTFVVILPDDLGGFEASLDAAQLASVLSDLQHPAPGPPQSIIPEMPANQLASLTLPRFAFTASVALADALASLGMADAFDPGAADFSGITSESALYLGDVYHEAFVAVDEEGVEAAAATGEVFHEVSGVAGVDLVLDRPFLFVVVDRPTGAVLFLGRVVDPTVP